MAELRKYNVTVGKNTTVLKLTVKDAERYGDDAVPVDDKPAAKTRGAQNKARTASDKGSTGDPSGDND